MIIEIDSSAVDDALGHGTSAQTSRECIENLLLAHHDGKHIVGLEKDAAMALEKLQGVWSSRAVGALQNIRGQYSEIRGLRRRLKWTIRVGVGPEYMTKSVESEGKTCIHVPVHHWRDLARVANGAGLLGENLVDTQFYKILGEAYLAENGWKWSLCFDEIPGGGDTTAPVLQKKVDEEKLTLAIVDNDRSFPGDMLGKTARRAQKIQRSALQHLRVLHVRDAENLIPSTLYEQAFHGTADFAEPLQHLKEAEARNSLQPWRDYADIKEGITLLDIALMSNRDCASFWRTAAKDLQRHECTKPNDGTACGQDKKNRRCFVTPAFGDQVFKTVVSWMEKQDRKRIAKLLCFPKTRGLAELGEMVIAWGIAEQRGRRA